MENRVDTESRKSANSALKNRVDTESLMRLMKRTLESLAKDLGHDAPFVRGFRFAAETVKMEAEKPTTGVVHAHHSPRL
jgi:hypothetical protein